MTRSELRTPTNAEIASGIAAGKRERSEAFWAVLSGFSALVRKHFEWRENMSRIAINGRCPNCSC
ncbi:MAG: hypothetical protein JJ959_02655 [Nisaea sp.]|jgi:hypothetical protein|uniref:hypothetical protein n=1 Tax=Nisaea sp. TaxID=2024842 RepID=UPI001B2D3E81|nr:hypothetical protein [Nisaea sp.]MBO6559405.1 hypothetical protein [Nisaea sp.]